VILGLAFSATKLAMGGDPPALTEHRINGDISITNPAAGPVVALKASLATKRVMFVLNRFRQF
jgi:hypothetical protein